MLLRYSATSPYVRKVLVTAHELGVAERIELAPADGWDPASDLAAQNPLSKVPTLVVDGIGPLYDSPVICAWLDETFTGDLLPAAGPDRWQTLRREALADGILDALVLLFIEQHRRAEGERSTWWSALQRLTVERALDAFEADAAALVEAPDRGRIALACALGYLELRFRDWGWRDQRPRLAAWFERVARRASMVATAPPA